MPSSAPRTQRANGSDSTNDSSRENPSFSHAETFACFDPAKLGGFHESCLAGQEGSDMMSLSRINGHLQESAQQASVTVMFEEAK